MLRAIGRLASQGIYSRRQVIHQYHGWVYFGKLCKSLRLPAGADQQRTAMRRASGFIVGRTVPDEDTSFQVEPKIRSSGE